MEEFGFPPVFPAPVDEVTIVEESETLPKDKSKGILYFQFFL